MLSERPDLPVLIRALTRMGRLYGVDKKRFLQFEKGILFELAQKRTGLDDPGDPQFLKGFECLLDSAKADLNLHAFGRYGIHGMLVTILANRMLFTDWKRRRNTSVRLLPPIVILGLPRSGTTFLHRLLSVDGQLRVLPLWKLMRPFPQLQGPDNRRKEVVKALRFRRWIAPGLDEKHYTRADSPEECIWLMNLSFLSQGFWVSAPFYRYVEWLATANRDFAYSEYRLLLELFQEEEPNRRLLLKAPGHLGSLREVFNTLPEAQVIQLHRDPVEVVPSLNSLFYTVHSAVSERIDVERLAQTNLRFLAGEALRNMEARKHLPDRVLDMRYEDLVRDPLAELKRVYRCFGMTWKQQMEVRFKDFLEREPKGKYGLHQYTLEDFGLTGAMVDRAFLEYREEFRCLL